MEHRFSFGSGDGTEWLATIPLQIKFVWTPGDSLTRDSLKVYRLDLYTPSFDNSRHGEFVITTNHPELHEIRITGNIDK